MITPWFSMALRVVKATSRCGIISFHHAGIMCGLSRAMFQICLQSRPNLPSTVFTSSNALCQRTLVMLTAEAPPTLYGSEAYICGISGSIDLTMRASESSRTSAIPKLDMYSSALPCA